MDSRDARLRTELIVLIVLKIVSLTVLWFLFVKGAHVSVDADAMARHAAPACVTQTGERCAPATRQADHSEHAPAPGLSATGAPNGH